MTFANAADLDRLSAAIYGRSARTNTDESSRRSANRIARPAPQASVHIETHANIPASCSTKAANSRMPAGPAGAEA